MTPEQNLLERALAKSGLSLRKFAEQLVARDERTVRRWREGSQTIPETALRWMRHYVDAD
jgi:DNA-binding transcriptional regulator YiaG